MTPTIQLIAAVTSLTLSAPSIPDAEIDSFVGDDSAQDDLFGTAIAVEGPYVVVGAPGAAGSTGAAYVFKRQRDGTYLQLDTLLADDGVADDLFGTSVAIQKDTILVGAPGDDADEGAAYAFKRQRNGTYLQVDKLTAEDNAAGDLFGTSVAFDKNTAAVGAPGDASAAGSVYVFRRLRSGAWDQVTRLAAAIPAADAEFGASVAVQKDTIIIGAPGATSDAGAAYVFALSDEDAWMQIDTFTSLDAAANDRFGASVSLDKTTALVGAPGDDSDAGAAYVFTLVDAGTWEQEDKLIAEDDAASDAVGASVALDGPTAVVGAPGDDSSRGAVFIFRRERDATWPQAAKLMAGTGVADDVFGAAVGCSKGFAVGGAPGAGTDTGGAYIFR